MEIKNTRTVISKDDLGLKSSDISVKPTLFYENNDHKFSLDYEKLDFSGSKTLTKDIIFNNKTYNVNTNIKSTMEFDWYRVGYAYKLLNNSSSTLSLGLDLHIVDADIGIKDSTGTINESYSETIAIPAISLDGSYMINDTFGIDGKVSGIKVGSKASYTQYYAGVSAKCVFIENATWKAGYQYKKIDINIDDFDGDLKFKGLYLALNYKF
jgi:hypothetical protein